MRWDSARAGGLPLRCDLWQLRLAVAEEFGIGQGGGRIVAAGRGEAISACPESHTGRALLRQAP